MMQNCVKIFLVSNMYPSAENPSYGIFVKNSEDILQKGNFIISSKAVIKGRGKNIIEKFKKYIVFYWEIFYFGLKADYDLIYVHYISHTAIPLIFLQLFSKKKLAVNVHGSDVIPAKFFHRPLFYFSKNICRQANLVVTPSGYFKNVVMEKYRVPSEKIFVYPSGGIDMNFFKPHNRSENSGKFYVGYVSRITKNKGWDVYLKALHHIKKNNSEINFQGIVIGDGDERKFFLEMLHELSMQNEISYFGAVAQKDLPDFYNKMDVFIFPSSRLAESLGLVGLEAMSCGIPVIGAKQGGCMEYVTDSENGFLFEVGNYKSLAEKIINYYKLSQEEKNKLKENARKTVLNFETEKVSQNLFEKLKNLK